MRHIDEASRPPADIRASYAASGAATPAVKLVRRRYFPIIGDGGGVLSWIHLDDAAAAT